LFLLDLVVSVFLYYLFLFQSSFLLHLHNIVSRKKLGGLVSDKFNLMEFRLYEHMYLPKAEDRQCIYRQIQIPIQQTNNQHTKLNY